MIFSSFSFLSILFSFFFSVSLSPIFMMQAGSYSIKVYFYVRKCNLFRKWEAHWQSFGINARQIFHCNTRIYPIRTHRQKGPNAKLWMKEQYGRSSAGNQKESFLSLRHSQNRHQIHNNNMVPSNNLPVNGWHREWHLYQLNICT